MSLDPNFQTYSNTEPAPAGWYQRRQKVSLPEAIPPYLAEFLDVLDNIEKEHKAKIEYQSLTWWIAYNAYIQGLLDGTKAVR